MLKYSYFIFLIVSILSCTYYNHNFPYDFDNPSKIIRLSKELKEISGLSYKDKNTLYAIQDEKGEIFEIDLNLGTSKKVISFKKAGDFEGLVEVKGDFFVLKSDGSIYEVKQSGKYKKYDFFDSDEDFEFEGICWDKERNNLLIACKQHGKKADNKFIWVYSFSLEKMSYLGNEFFKIPKIDVHEKFKPSAISTDNEGIIYLLAANTFTIASFSRIGNLLNKAQLPYSGYPQAEGISFGPNGTLYLSSEKGDQGNGKVIILKKHEK